MYGLWQKKKGKVELPLPLENVTKMKCVLQPAAITCWAKNYDGNGEQMEIGHGKNNESQEGRRRIDKQTNCPLAWHKTSKKIQRMLTI